MHFSEFKILINFSPKEEIQRRRNQPLDRDENKTEFREILEATKELIKLVGLYRGKKKKHPCQNSGCNSPVKTQCKKNQGKN